MDSKSHDGQFPRTLQEAGWRNDREWEDKMDGTGWPAAIVWAVIGAFVLWVFFTLVLGAA